MEGGVGGAAVAGGESGGSAVLCTCAEWGIACSCDGGASDGSAAAGAGPATHPGTAADPYADDASGTDDCLAATLDGQGRVYGTSDLGLEFSTRSSDATLAADLTAGAEPFAEFLHDCRLVDTDDLPDTFWLAATATPATRLEQLAREVFDWHTSGLQFDRESSGAEWWCQIRDAQGARPGVGPHWDKDENMRRDWGVWVHPQLSTVTYMTSGGAPTVVMDKLIRGNGEMVGGRAIGAATISHPVAGKHLVFDGRLLHLVAPELAVASPSAAVAAAGDQLPLPRLTFLVNIWLHHKPRSLQPLPEELLPLLQPAEPAAPQLTATGVASLETPQATLPLSGAERPPWDPKGSTNRAQRWDFGAPFIFSPQPHRGLILPVTSGRPGDWERVLAAVG